MSIVNSGGAGNCVSSIGTDASGITFENLAITMSGSGNNSGFSLAACSATLRDITIVGASSDSEALGLYFSSNSANANTINAYNVKAVVTAGGGDGGKAFYVLNNNGAGATTLNLYDCYGESTANAGTSDSGLRVRSITTTQGIANAYGCTFDGAGTGADSDVYLQTAGTLTLYDCTLVNGTTSGTIKTNGISTVSSDPVSTIGGSVGRIKVISQDGSACYMLLYAG